MGITGSKSNDSLGDDPPFKGDDGYGYGQAAAELQIPSVSAAELADVDHNNKIPMVFRWTHPAEEVWVAGTFTGRF